MRSPISRACASAATVGMSCARYLANSGSTTWSTRATSRSYWSFWLQPSTPCQVPSPGYSARYTSANTQVIMNSHSHQRGSGLLYSWSVSSQL